MEEDKYSFWLANIPGVGNAGIEKLREGGKKSKDIYEMSETEIALILGEKKAKGLIESKSNYKWQEAYHILLERGIRFTTQEASEYPRRLRYLAGAPFILYYFGELPEETTPTVAIIGARECSEYGRKMAGWFGKELAYAGIQVVSGLARGVDCISQRAAFDAEGKVYAVMGNGVDICYPQENKELYNQIKNQGGIISEYPIGTAPTKTLFPARNRIISGLADIVLVVEARKRSGTYITVTQALEQGRDVFAVPGRATDALSDGCNLLIRQGAGMAYSPQAILDEFAIMPNGHTNAHVTDAEEIDDTKTKHPSEDARGRNSSLREEILTRMETDLMDISEIQSRVLRERTVELPALMYELTMLQIEEKVENIGGMYRRIDNDIIRV